MNYRIGTNFFILIALIGWITFGLTSTAYRDLGTRGQAFLDVVSASSPLSFPLTNYPDAQSVDPLLKLSKIHLNTKTFMSKRNINSWVVGDDLGLPWLGVLAYNILPFNNPFISISIFYIGFVMLCFYLYQRALPPKKEYAAFLVFFGFCFSFALIFVFNKLVPWFRGYDFNFEFTAPWHPYTYVLLAPLLVAALDLTLNKATQFNSPSLEYNGNDKLALILIFLSLSALFSIRQGVLILLFPYLFLNLYKFFKPLKRKKAILFFMICISALIFSKFFLTVVTNNKYLRSYGTSHVTWHTIWCYLDDGKGTLQFRATDTDANLYANKISGKFLVYSSNEYEAVLKKDVLETIIKHPYYLVKVYAKKLFARPILLLLAIISLVILQIRTINAAGDEQAALSSLLLITLSLSLNRIVEMFATNNFIYSLPSIGGEVVLLILLLMFMCRYLHRSSQFITGAWLNLTKNQQRIPL